MKMKAYLFYYNLKYEFLFLIFLILNRGTCFMGQRVVKEKKALHHSWVGDYVKVIISINYFYTKKA